MDALEPQARVGGWYVSEGFLLGEHCGGTVLQLMCGGGLQVGDSSVEVKVLFKQCAMSKQ